MNRVTEDINRLLDIRTVRHIMFWVVYILTMTYIHGSGIDSGHYYAWLFNYLVELPVLMGLTYILTYLVIPKLLLPRKFFQFFIVSLMCLLFFSAMNVILDRRIIYPFSFPDKLPVTVKFIPAVLKNAFGLVFPVVIFISISFAKYINERRQDETILKQKRLQMQLEKVRNQMHPVFLKDALNDLYLVAIEQPSNLPDMILRLSDIMHYLVYECHSPRVSLRQEERAIRQYIGFEKMLYSNYNISINVEGNPENTEVSPYILFPLMRAVTVFRKGDTLTDDVISVSIRIRKKNLVFEAFKESYSGSSTLDFEWKDEIALARKQLDSTYSWKNKLDIFETERKLLVKLNIDL